MRKRQPRRIKYRIETEEVNFSTIVRVFLNDVLRAVAQDYTIEVFDRSGKEVVERHASVANLRFWGDDGNDTVDEYDYEHCRVARGFSRRICHLRKQRQAHPDFFGGPYVRPRKKRALQLQKVEV